MSKIFAITLLSLFAAGSVEASVAWGEMSVAWGECDSEGTHTIEKIPGGDF